MSGTTTSDTWLVVGLGNPGDRYAGTFHNLGFRTIELLLVRALRGAASGRWESMFHGLVKKVQIEGRRALLLEPQTFMNLSGESVRPAAEKFQVSPEHMVVVHDDVDLQPGQVRIKVGGGSGGHRGLDSCIQHLPDAGFVRVRIGIGHHEHMLTEQWVLTRIPASDRDLFDRSVEDAAAAVEMVLARGASLAMNDFNGRGP